MYENESLLFHKLVMSAQFTLRVFYERLPFVISGYTDVFALYRFVPVNALSCALIDYNTAVLFQEAASFFNETSVGIN